MPELDERLARRFLRLGGKGADAAEQLHHAPFADKLDYAFSVGIKPEHWDAAHSIGSARLQVKRLRGRAPHESRGADDERVDTEGAIAELLIGQALGSYPAAQFAALLDHRPVRSADMVLGGKPLDIKSVGQGKRSVNINCDQHGGKNPAGIVVVHLIRADVADVFVCSGEAVARWPRIEKLRGMALDPRRWHWRQAIPDVLEPLTAT